MNTSFRWIMKPVSDSKTATALSTYPPIIIDLLSTRGISTPSEAEAFFTPTYSDLLPSNTLPDIDIFLKRLKKAIDEKEHITLFGDYDVDGVSSVYILETTLKALNADFESYIPDRNTEGYGLKNSIIDKLHKRKTSLIITVDTGISDIEPIRYAKEQGIDTLVSDHHTPKNELPDAIATVNPKIPLSSYGFMNLAGAGVALKIALAISDFFGISLENLIDIASIATVADIVPLLGENRTIVYLGLREIKNTTNFGLRALAENSGVSLSTIDTIDIGFKLGPRINAAGRMVHAKLALDLLKSKNKQQADMIARELDHYNKNRQIITKTQYDKSLSELTDELPFGIIIASEEFDAGIIGLTAGKLCNEFYRPTIVFSIKGNIAKGSARSIPEYNIVNALTKFSNFFINFGGHAGAAGIEMETNRIPEFKKAFENHARNQLTKQDLKPTILVDASIDLEEITMEFFEQIQKFEPFGEKNPKPVFGSHIDGFLFPRRIGKEQNHLKTKAVSGSQTLDVIGFQKAYLFEFISSPGPFSIVYSISKNTWNGNTNLQLELLDVKKPHFRKDIS